MQNHKSIGLIGDLDGNYEKYLIAINELQVVDNENKWRAGDMILLFSGDILVDRNNEGIKILNSIIHLRKDAIQSGGDCIILAGNHEEFLIGYLRGKSVNLGGINLEEIDFPIGSGLYGMNEFFLFGRERQAILRGFLSEEYYKKILIEISQMRLLYLYKNTLHFHTPPSRNILDFLWIMYEKCQSIEKSVDIINSLWGMALRHYLFGEEYTGNEDFPTPESAYSILAGIFLSTYNSSYTSFIRRGGNLDINAGCIWPEQHKTYTILQDSGINSLFHGHDDDSIDIPGFEIHGMNRKWKKISL